MARDNSGIRYASIILFSSKLLSLITGLLFTIMITRNLSSEEFGVWGNISDLLAYFTLMGSVIPSWSLRFLLEDM